MRRSYIYWTSRGFIWLITFKKKETWAQTGVCRRRYNMWSNNCYLIHKELYKPFAGIRRHIRKSSLRGILECFGFMRIFKNNIDKYLLFSALIVFFVCCFCIYSRSPRHLQLVCLPLKYSSPALMSDIIEPGLCFWITMHNFKICNNIQGILTAGIKQGG